MRWGLSLEEAAWENQGIHKRLVRSWRFEIADNSNHRREIGAGFQHLTLVPYLTSFLEPYRKYPLSLASFLTIRILFRLPPQDISLVKASPWSGALTSTFHTPPSSLQPIISPFLTFPMTSLPNSLGSPTLSSQSTSNPAIAFRLLLGSLQSPRNDRVKRDSAPRATSCLTTNFVFHERLHSPRANSIYPHSLMIGQCSDPLSSLSILRTPSPVPSTPD